MDIMRAEMPDAVTHALKLITECETALGYKLSRGECNDLLLDNTHWSRTEVVAVMDSIPPR